MLTPVLLRTHRADSDERTKRKRQQFAGGLALVGATVAGGVVARRALKRRPVFKGSPIPLKPKASNRLKRRLRQPKYKPMGGVKYGPRTKRLPNMSKPDWGNSPQTLIL